MKKTIIRIAVALLFVVMASAASAGDFETIRTNMKNMTSFEWDAYVESLVGTPIVWDGWVVDVNRLNQDYSFVLIDMDPPGVNGRAEVAARIKGHANVAKLRKTQKIRFSGPISGVDEVRWDIKMIRIDRAVIEAAE